jgi:hypothetical protein
MIDTARYAISYEQKQRILGHVGATDHSARTNGRPGRVESWRGNPLGRPLSVSGDSPFVPD